MRRNGRQKRVVYCLCLLGIYYVVWIVLLSIDTDRILAAITQHRHELSIQRSTLDHLQSLGSFPKKFHLIWPDKDILNKTYDILEHGAKQLKRLNPSWEFIVHNYDNIHNTIENFNHPDVPQSMIEQLLSGHIVEQTDAFRLIVIYQVGGIYSDIDRVMNVNLDDIINPDTTKMMLPTYYDVNFCQDLFGSSPGNELILNVFKKQNEKRITLPRKNGWLKSSDLIHGLFQVYSNSIETELFGHTLKSSNETKWDIVTTQEYDPYRKASRSTVSMHLSNKRMPEVRHVLDEHSNGMIITKKDTWCNGLLVNNFEGCKRINRDSLYKAYNISGWASQVDAIWSKKK